MSTRPVQKLKSTSKTPKWVGTNVDWIITKSNIISSETTQYRSMDDEDVPLNRLSRMGLNYDAYNSQYLKREVEYLTNPFGLPESDVELPTIPQNVNIIRPPIDLLIGEKIKRPFRYTILEVGPAMTSYMEGYKKSMLLQNMVAQIENQVSGEQKLPEQSYEQIQKYIHYTSKNIYERAASLLLAKYRKQLFIDDKMLECWKDALIAGEEIAFVGDGFDSPEVERINPMMFDYERHQDLVYIEDASWCARKFYMSLGKILDSFNLTNAQVNKLAEHYDVGGTGFQEYDTTYRFSPIDTHDFNSSGEVLGVYHVCWESWEKIGYLKKENDQSIDIDIVNDTYIPQLGDVIEWDWRNSIWEAYRIDEDIIVNARLTDYDKLPYIGTIMNNTNTRNISLVELLRPLQAMYIEIVWRLLLTLARDKGKILNFEITSIPKQFGFDTKKWMHWLSFVGVNLMHQNDEGWDQRKNSPNMSPHLSQSDLSMAPVIREYIGLMDKIEELVGTMSGINKQRQGQVAPSELVGNVERSIIQSGTITEPWFAKQNFFEKRVYNAILESAQRMLQGKNETVMMALDDMSREFLTIPQDFPYKNLNIFISDANDDLKKLEAMRSLAGPAMQSGATLGEVGEIYISDNIADIMGKLKAIDQKKEEIQKAQSEQAQKIAEMNTQSAEKIRAEQSRIEDKKIEWSYKQAIDVANINHGSSVEEKSVETATDDIPEKKLNLDMRKHMDDLEQRQTEHQDKMKLEREKLAKQKQKVS